MGERLTVQMPRKHPYPATVQGVLVRVGDTVCRGQPLLHVELDKAVMELTSKTSGVIEELLVVAGQEIQPGSPLLVLRVAEPEDQWSPPDGTEYLR